MSQRSVFVDEGVLDINYVPFKLLHRESELRFLNSIFSFIIDAPYEMSQRAVIVGGVGSGKTALAQRFGKDLETEAARRRVKAKYIHVNCREVRGSLFMALNRVVRKLRPNFPDRGFSANELLDTLMRILDEEDTQLILSLDEVDALIEKEGGDALYNLTRVQEARLERPRRLNLICISKDPEAFQGLDRSTLSTLQRNIIRMSEYTSPELADIAPYPRRSWGSSGSWPPQRTEMQGTGLISFGGRESTLKQTTPRKFILNTCAKQLLPSLA
jgi:cell division control protein 6